MKQLKSYLIGILPIIITIIGVIAIVAGELDDAPGAILIGILIIVGGTILNIRLINKNLTNYEFNNN
jgi:heme/copper-type cytochrome/quinol oxidase subunit 4